MFNINREEIEKEIDVQGFGTKELLKQILIELKMFNLCANLSQQAMRTQQAKAQQKIKEMQNNLPPEAKAIFESLLQGVV